MRENRNLEYKENDHSTTYMKTISAFANYEGGQIIFGITDDGKVVGFSDPQEICLNLENRINDSIKPVPEYSLDIREDTTVVLTVEEGLYKPYLYKGKAYKRNDSATIEVGRMEYNRLVLAGRDQSYEEIPARNQMLTFQKLEQELIRVMGIGKLNQDILKTLELYTDKDGFNIAAELLADKNGFPGVDIVRFGNSIDEIMERKIIEKVSVLQMMEQSVQMFQTYYQYEKIEGTKREIVDKIPEKAFREAIANALVHRTWDVKASIKVCMYTDRMEIISPGGLPEGMGEEEYLNGQVSILRNPILGNVFFRLKYIEKFGTGILRINHAYAESFVKPQYHIFENSIQITLPVIQGAESYTEAEKILLDLLESGNPMARVQLEKASGFTKDKTIRVLNQLLEKQIVSKRGSGRGLRYYRN